MGCIVDAGFVLTGASCSPSAIAELLVKWNVLYTVVPKKHPFILLTIS